jgi:hypothetical protein
MKYLRLFEKESDYTQYVEGGDDYVEPHVVLIRNTDKVFYKQFIPPPISVGDVAYWDGSSVKTTPLSSWNTSLGTPVGVVMIGEGFVPNDGRARIIALDNLGEMSWDNRENTPDTSLPNYRKLPTTDNMGSTTNGITDLGYLPSDKFTHTQSFVDPKAKYGSMTPYIPSPYLGDAPNPAYYQAIGGGNALSDFNGLSNTQTLVELGSTFEAANACWNYKDAANSNLQWYLPAMGELGYLVARYKVINESIQAVGATSLDDYRFYYHSSSEYNSKTLFRLFLISGKISTVEDIEKRYVSYAHPCAILQ